MTDKQPLGAESVWQSFGFAFEGLGYVCRTQRNFKIHLVMAVLVLSASWFFQIKPLEWVIIVLMIGLMMAVESVNTAIEVWVDRQTQGNFDTQAKIVKDVSAAACLLMALTAVVVGCLIFWPYLRNLMY